jgi:hypothetical protein
MIVNTNPTNTANTAKVVTRVTPNGANAFDDDPIAALFFVFGLLMDIWSVFVVEDEDPFLPTLFPVPKGEAVGADVGNDVVGVDVGADVGVVVGADVGSVVGADVGVVVGVIICCMTRTVVCST